MTHAHPVTDMTYGIELYEERDGDNEPPFSIYISQLFEISRYNKISPAFACLVTPADTSTVFDNTGIRWNGLNVRISLDSRQIAGSIQHEEKAALVHSFVESTHRKFAALERCTERGLRNRTVSQWMADFNKYSYAQKKVETPNEHATWTMVLLRKVWQMYDARFTDLISFLSICPEDTAISPIQIADIGSAIAAYGIGQDIPIEQAIWRYNEFFRHTKILGEKI